MRNKVITVCLGLGLCFFNPARPISRIGNPTMLYPGIGAETELPLDFSFQRQAPVAPGAPVYLTSATTQTTITVLPLSSLINPEFRVSQPGILPELQNTFPKLRFKALSWSAPCARRFVANGIDGQLGVAYWGRGRGLVLASDAKPLSRAVVDLIISTLNVTESTCPTPPSVRPIPRDTDPGTDDGIVVPPSDDGTPVPLPDNGTPVIPSGVWDSVYAPTH